jgi:hypothetical protein
MSYTSRLHVPRARMPMRCRLPHPRRRMDSSKEIRCVQGFCLLLLLLRLFIPSPNQHAQCSEDIIRCGGLCPVVAGSAPCVRSASGLPNGGGGLHTLLALAQQRKKSHRCVAAAKGMQVFQGGWMMGTSQYCLDRCADAAALFFFSFLFTVGRLSAPFPPSSCWAHLPTPLRRCGAQCCRKAIARRAQRLLFHLHR